MEAQLKNLLVTAGMITALGMALLVVGCGKFEATVKEVSISGRGIGGGNSGDGAGLVNPGGRAGDNLVGTGQRETSWVETNLGTEANSGSAGSNDVGVSPLLSLFLKGNDAKVLYDLLQVPREQHLNAGFSEKKGRNYSCQEWTVGPNYICEFHFSAGEGQVFENSISNSKVLNGPDLKLYNGESLKFLYPFTYGEVFISEETAQNFYEGLNLVEREAKEGDEIFSAGAQAFVKNGENIECSRSQSVSIESAYSFDYSCNFKLQPFDGTVGR